MAKTAKKTVDVAPVATDNVDNVVSLAVAKTRGRKKGSTNKTIDFDPSTLTVEVNIPVPTKTGRGRKSNVDKYPFANMAVGASFHTAVNKSNVEAIRARIMNAAKAYKAANPDFNYTSRLTMRDDGNGTFGFWRIASE